MPPSPSTLSLSGFGVGFDQRVILADVTLDIPARGVCVLLGPAGGGKSTLMRTLAGLNDATPSFRSWGQATYQGSPLGEGNRPALVLQDMRYFVSTVRENLVSGFPDRQHLTRAQQQTRLEGLLADCGVTDLCEHLDSEALSLPSDLRRLLSVLRAMVGGSALVCLDESTANTDDATAERVLALIRWYSHRRAVLFVTHAQTHARSVANTCALLAGGRVQESALADDFFERPVSPVTRRFLITGSTNLPSPDADAATLDDDAPRPPPLPAAARQIAATTARPRGFRWLHPGRLGGLPRPGIIAPLEDDLGGLRDLGVSVLINLEETATVRRSALEAYGVEGVHFPVPDMQAPTVAATAQLCRQVKGRLDTGAVVAFHCKAGQGRTGTLLASHLIFTGASALDALDRVRSIDPKWVTSSAQVRFLETFAHYIRWLQGPPIGSPPAPVPPTKEE